MRNDLDIKGTNDYKENYDPTEEVHKANDTYFPSSKEIFNHIKEEASLLPDSEKLEPFVTLLNGAIVEPQFTTEEDLKGMKRYKFE